MKRPRASSVDSCSFVPRVCASQLWFSLRLLLFSPPLNVGMGNEHSQAGGKQAGPAPSLAQRRHVDLHLDLSAEPSVPEPTYKTTDINKEYDIRWRKTLGRGAAGYVVECQHRVSQQKYALKILPNNPLGKREVSMHFFCHDHENILHAIEVFANFTSRGPDDRIAPRNYLFLVLEMLEGGELFDRLRAAQHFDEKQARILMLQMSRAICHLHSKDVAHRDLKPENFLFKAKPLDGDPSGNVGLLKLADFGCAKIDHGTLHTTCGIGTVPYLSAEILEAQDKSNRPNDAFSYTKSCDLWSLGVIFYVVLCGHLPFICTGDQQQMRDKIKQIPVAFDEEHWSGISEEAKNLVRELLCRDPAKRITIEGVLAHPWMNAPHDSPQIPLDSHTKLAENEHHLKNATSLLKAHLSTIRSVSNDATDQHAEHDVIHPATPPLPTLAREIDVQDPATSP
eukprot:m.639063 g.639063  ORF g.639063 m.639063 type:complete len:452 (-) comp58332_c0_seq6:2319-3674(-)